MNVIKINNKEEVRKVIRDTFELWVKNVDSEGKYIRPKLLWRYFEEEVSVAIDIDFIEETLRKYR